MPASLICSRAMVTHAIDRHRWDAIADGAVFLQHGAVRDLVPAVAVDRMRHQSATADQRCGHIEPPHRRLMDYRLPVAEN